LAKARFWQHWAGVPMNDRQTQLLNKLLDGVDGKLTCSNWAAYTPKRSCCPSMAIGSHENFYREHT
jgi:hypothetical protein